MNGISSSWLGLMAGSKVGMMAVSLAPSPELGDHAPSSAVAVTLSLLQIQWPSAPFGGCSWSLI